ncbi:MAG: CehA/McbA family metallohydrolase [Planctomycetota bacterium]
MATIQNPYLNDAPARLRGNLHCHTTRSDGEQDPQSVVDEYAGHGHDFLMLSDHDRYPDHTGLDPRGMVLVPGYEITVGGPHMLHVGARSVVDPVADRQAVLNAAAEAGGFVVCCHPHWEPDFDHFPQEELDRLAGYLGVEILNAGIIGTAGDELATDSWDMLLSEGRKVWGFGNDDAHHAQETGHAWNVVWARERTVAGILEAFRKGSFYVSSGIDFAEIRVYGDLVTARAPGAQKLFATSAHGVRVAEAEGELLRFRLNNLCQTYIRITAVGRPDKYAFSQPLFIAGSAGEAGGAPPTMAVPRLRKSVVLTGRVDDAGWQTAGRMRQFIDATTGRPSPFAPEARIAHDGAALFLGLVCPEPMPEALVTKVAAHGDPATWMDDSLEIFIDPFNRRDSYFHLMVNAAGFACLKGVKRAVERGLVTTKAGRREYAWAVEIAVPFALLGGAPASGATWGFNIVRSKQTDPPRDCRWSHTGMSNHMPRLFGEIKFE